MSLAAWKAVGVVRASCRQRRALYAMGLPKWRVKLLTKDAATQLISLLLAQGQQQEAPAENLN